MCSAQQCFTLPCMELRPPVPSTRQMLQPAHVAFRRKISMRALAGTTLKSIRCSPIVVSDCVPCNGGDAESIGRPADKTLRPMRFRATFLLWLAFSIDGHCQTALPKFSCSSIGSHDTVDFRRVDLCAEKHAQNRDTVPESRTCCSSTGRVSAESPSSCADIPGPSGSHPLLFVGLSTRLGIYLLASQDDTLLLLLLDEAKVDKGGHCIH